MVNKIFFAKVAVKIIASYMRFCRFVKNMIIFYHINIICGQDDMNIKTYEYDAIIQSAGNGGAYVAFPYDIRTEFGKGRVKVRATFDGEPYEGSVVNMGVKNPDGSVCYIIGILKDIRAKIGKRPGDMVRVVIRERE